MNNELLIKIQKIKDAEMVFNQMKSKDSKDRLEYLIGDIISDLHRGTASKEQKEENTFIVSNILPIIIRALKGSWYLSSVLLELPQVELNTSIWSILVKNNLIKESKVKYIDYEISPFNKGLNQIFKNIVGQDDLNPKYEGVNYEKNTATGTNALILLHIVGEKNNSFKDGNYWLYSEIEKIYNKLNPKMTLKEFYEKRMDIGQNFPNWKPILPKDYEFSKSFDLKYLNNILLTLYKNKITNGVTNVVAFIFDTKEGEFIIGVDAKLLSDLCESMIMAGETMVDFYFSSPFRAVVIFNQKNKFPKTKTEEFFMSNNFGLIMPMRVDDYSVRENVDMPTIKYNDTYDFDIQVGQSPSYNLIQGQAKQESKKEPKQESKADLYNQIIEGYELAIEIETNMKKVKMYDDLIGGYKLALELE